MMGVCAVHTSPEPEHKKQKKTGEKKEEKFGQTRDCRQNHAIYMMGVCAVHTSPEPERSSGKGCAFWGQTFPTSIVRLRAPEVELAVSTIHFRVCTEVLVFGLAGRKVGQAARNERTVWSCCR